MQPVHPSSTRQLKPPIELPSSGLKCSLIIAERPCGTRCASGRTSIRLPSSIMSVKAAQAERDDRAMPGLRGIDNIKKAMERRERERDESLKLALEIEREETAGTPQVAGDGAPSDIERRLAERLADQRRAAEKRAAAWRGGTAAGAFSATRFLAAAAPRRPAETAASNPAPPALPRAREDVDDARPLPRQQEVLDAIRTALAGRSEGEIVLKKTVLDAIGIERSSAVRVIRRLERAGYLQYRPLCRCVWVRLLKG